MSRTATRGLIAASLTGTVAFSGMVVPLAHSAEPSNGNTPILENGTFAWPIKASFLNHVQGLLPVARLPPVVVPDSRETSSCSPLTRLILL